jgi:hypothetical protein
MGLSRIVPASAGLCELHTLRLQRLPGLGYRSERALGYGGEGALGRPHEALYAPVPRVKNAKQQKVSCDCTSVCSSAEALDITDVPTRGKGLSELAKKL